MPGSDSQLTLADIARLAGVGLATASRALNNHRGVSEETRQRVVAIAAEHAFVVSPEAAGLARGSRGRVALVVPHFARWFFGEMIEGIESVLRGAEIDVLLYHVGSLEDRRSFFDKLPARRKVDAVIVIGFPVEEEERGRLELLKVHIVAAGGQHAEYPNVRIDDYRAGRQAMDHLLFLGHRRIGMIEAVDPDQQNEPIGRSLAYYRAIEDAGLEFDPALVASAPWGGETGAHAMGSLLSIKEPPTAVYVHSDEVAAGALRTIRRAGLEAPTDISVIGIDDHPIATLLDLTTIRQAVFLQGQLAAQLALDLTLGNTPHEREIVVPTELVVRSTTGPPRSVRR